MQVAWHISLESFRQGLQFGFRPHFDWRFSQEVMGLQSCKSPNFGNFETPNLGVLGQNDIWVLALWPRIENTITGKASPKFGPWWILWVRVCSWLIQHQKCFNYALSNLLFGSCRFVWVIDLLVTRPSPHLGVLICPSTPKVLRAKECTLTPSFSVVSISRLAFESFKECGGVS